jgi:hypothetical protein
MRLYQIAGGHQVGNPRRASESGRHMVVVANPKKWVCNEGNASKHVVVSFSTQFRDVMLE